MEREPYDFPRVPCATPHMHDVIVCTVLASLRGTEIVESEDPDDNFDEPKHPNDIDFMLAERAQIATGTDVTTPWLASGGIKGLHRTIVTIPSKVVYIAAGTTQSCSLTPAQIVYDRSGGRFKSNCALMRCAGATLAMFERGIRDVATVRTVCERTHVAPECIAACEVFSQLIWNALSRGAMHAETTHADVQLAFETGRAAIRDISACGLDKFGRETHILTTVALIGYCAGLCDWAGSQGKKLDFGRTLDTIEQAGGDVDTNCAIAGLLLASRYDFSELARTAKFPSRKWLEEHI